MILFIIPLSSAFVKNDLKILMKHFRVCAFHYHANKKFSQNIKEQFLLFFWLLKNIYYADKIYIWFADYHSFLPILTAKIFRKKSYLVLGGYDVVYIPDLKYGSFSNPLRSFMTRFSIRNATLNLPVSQYVKNTILKREPKILCQVVYNGLRNFSLKEKTPKENLIITACKCDNAQRFTLKGLSLFIECARKIPEFNFAIIGFSPSLKILAGDIPDNLQLIDFLPQHRLQEFYMKARIYCQFSIVESFSLATAEAMFFGAVPVVNNVGALSELIGNTGFLLQNYTIDEAVEKLNKALAAEDLGKMAHDRILKKFTLQNRETKLLKILSNRIL